MKTKNAPNIFLKIKNIFIKVKNSRFWQILFVSDIDYEKIQDQKMDKILRYHYMQY